MGVPWDEERGGGGEYCGSIWDGCWQGARDRGHCLTLQVQGHHSQLAVCSTHNRGNYCWSQKLKGSSINSQLILIVEEKASWFLVKACGCHKPSLNGCPEFFKMSILEKKKLEEAEASLDVYFEFFCWRWSKKTIWNLRTFETVFPKVHFRFHNSCCKFV